MAMMQRLFSFFGCKKKPTDNILYIFDFDQTILAEDSEAAISSISKFEIPEDIIQYYMKGNWTAYCQNLIDFVILVEGIKLEDIVNSLNRLKLLSGMDELLHKVQTTVKENPDSHLVVISGSNDFFVQSVLSNLEPPVVPSAIISNHANRIEGPPGPRLIFQAYEQQTTCHKCPRNLCKGAALTRYIEENGPFKTIYYVGDGLNDVCPAIRLRPSDVLFVRKNFALDNIITQGQFINSKVEVQARVLKFETGEDIQNNMRFNFQ